MNREELLKLREQVAGHTKSLVLSGDDADPAVKLTMLMGMIRSGDVSQEVLQAAYETAQKLPEGQEKLDAMFDLMYEIDAELAATGDQTEEDEQPQQEAEQQP